MIIEFMVTSEGLEAQGVPCEEVFIEAEFVPEVDSSSTITCDKKAQDVAAASKPLVTIKPELEKFNLMRFLKVDHLTQEKPDDEILSASMVTEKKFIF